MEVTMPVERGKDKDGPFYRWGKHGARYHYKSGNKKSRELAHDKAAKQGRAIKWQQSQ
jgi:hypothetical protein